MKKSNVYHNYVEVQAFIRRNKDNIPEFYVKGWGPAFELMVDKFLRGDSVELTMTIQPEGERKTITEKQRGYIFGCLGPMVELFLRDSGYAPYDTHQAIEIIKEHPDVDFTRPDYSGGELKKVPLSLSDEANVPRRLINEFIDRVFLLLATEGYNPPTPEEYKKGKRWRSVK